MTIRNLEIFIEVCRQMNMSKAAELLMISQSSVSQAIATLEKEFQVILFERFNHKLYLTPAGNKMSFLAYQVLQSVEQLEKHMKNSEFPDLLYLGVCTTIGNCLIHPLSQTFHKQYNINFDIEINNSKSLEKHLLNARLDLAIIQSSKASQYLEYVPFLRDDLCIICWNTHPFNNQKLPLSALEKEYFIAREKGSGTELLLEQAFFKHNLHLHKHWLCNNPESVKQSVLNKCGIALISKFLVQKELSSGILGEIFITDYKFEREFVLAYHRDKIKNTSFKQFINYCTFLGNDGLKKLIYRTSQEYDKNHNID